MRYQRVIICVICVFVFLLLGGTAAAEQVDRWHAAVSGGFGHVFNDALALQYSMAVFFYQINSVDVSGWTSAEVFLIDIKIRKMP